MTKADAIKLCEKYGVNHSVHPRLIVTANQNIYLTGEVDPVDVSEKIFINEVSETEKPIRKKSNAAK
jgi:hypothetical protein